MINLERLKEKFIALYGGSKAGIRVFTAPGRVNLIGEHIDYNGGRVLPAGLSLANTVLIRPAAGTRIRLAADDLEGVLVECMISQLDNRKGKDWGSYQLGVAYELGSIGYDISGCDMLFYSDLPFGAGLSSSASIEICTALALATLSNEKKQRKNGVDMIELALTGQRAENNYVGVNCGIMDQFASAMSKTGNAILLDCATLEYEYVPLELGEYSLVIANTNKKRELAASKYNERRAECDMAFAEMKLRDPEIKNLCSVTPERFYELSDSIKNAAVANRARHAAEENARVTRSVSLLRAGDLAGFGRLLNESHASLRDLYEVSCFELDVMADLAQNHASCLGGRMTGAGFGGCTVNIVKSADVPMFISEVGAKYSEKTGLPAEFYESGITGTAHEII